jgi:hypothetical protein
MSQVNREVLLQQLESVQAGLSSREIIEQSSCFVFKDGNVVTFNDEVSCSRPCELGSFTGAVQAAPLLSILQKLADESLDVTVEEGELRLHSKRREVGIRHEEKVELPVGSVEAPGKWIPLTEEFLEGIRRVQESASTDQSKFVMTCIHLHPKWIEACNNYQAHRAVLKTGVKASTLVRKDAIKHVVTLGMTEFSETTTWIHFRNKAGLVLSARRYVEEYPDLTKLFEFEGSAITLPKGLAQAAERASVFSAESSDDNQVLVELNPTKGLMRVKGHGASGWYREVKKVKYEGPAMSFLVSPETLIDITSDHSDAEVTTGRLRVTTGKVTFVTCLGAVEDLQKKKAKSEDEETPSEE